MPEFRYEAVDAGGRARQGLLEAATARQVRDRLRADGLYPTAVDAVTAREDFGPSRLRIPTAVLALLTRQLATLVESGMPLDQALTAVAAQSEHAVAVPVLTAVREQVTGGETLAGALSRFPRTFSDLYRGLVAVGAETGQLGQVLSRLADYLEARQLLRQKLTMAMIYPALVTIIALAVIATLLLYVVPQVVAVYQQSRQSLPWLTQALIAVSNFLRSTIFYWLALLIVGLIVALILWRQREWRERVHRALLRLPFSGKLIRGIDTARFASTLAILTGSGAPLLRALETAANVVWSLPLKQAATEAASLVREGVSLSRALDSRHVFPPLLIHLVANGEAGGQLPAMLDRAAREQELEVERRFTWLAALIQPALIVAMGAVVLILVLAVMLPIVSMNQLIR